MSLKLKEYLDADWARLCCLIGTSVAPRQLKAHFGPRFAPVVILRCAQVLNAKGYTRAAKLFSLINFLIFNLEVPARLYIGPGLVIPHPQGTVLGAAYIGSNVTIFHQVTLGGKSADFEYASHKRPHVADNVTISVGAKILGAIHLGEGSVIGANAVVLSDVPPASMAVGVPAKISALNKAGETDD